VVLSGPTAFSYSIGSTASFDSSNVATVSAAQKVVVTGPPNPDLYPLVARVQLVAASFPTYTSVSAVSTRSQGCAEPTIGQCYWSYSAEGSICDVVLACPQQYDNLPFEACKIDLIFWFQRYFNIDEHHS
jgi:hypothetical protein